MQQQQGDETRFWRRKQLAAHWQIDVRTVDRMRAEGRLGRPTIISARTPVWSDEQRRAAERSRKKPA